MPTTCPICDYQLTVGQPELVTPYGAVHPACMNEVLAKHLNGQADKSAIQLQLKVSLLQGLAKQALASLVLLHQYEPNSHVKARLRVLMFDMLVEAGSPDEALVHFDESKQYPHPVPIPDRVCFSADALLPVAQHAE